MGYVDGNTALTAPLNTASVAKCLGANSLDVGTLCTSELINKWSFHKPMGGSSPQELTLEEMYELDGGFSNLEEMKAETLHGAQNHYTGENPLDWEKVTPTWYRLTDFIGYINYAKDFTPTCKAVENTTYPAGTIYLDMSWAADVQQYLPYMKTTSEYPNLGVLIYDTQGTVYYYHVGLVKNYASVSGVHIALDTLLPESTNTTLYFIPILVNNGQYTGPNETPFGTEVIRLYTNDEMKNTGTGSGQLQYAPFNMLTLGSTPFSMRYKHYTIRLFDGIYLTFVWEDGGYTAATSNTVASAKFSGDVGIWNKNSQDVECDIEVTNNDARTDYQTMHSATNITLSYDEAYSCLTGDGFTNNPWYPYSDVYYGRVQVAVTIRVRKLGSTEVVMEKQYSKAFVTNEDTLDSEKYNSNLPINIIAQSFSELVGIP